MYKNQLQELAQRSCFNLPSYTCVRQGPDHAPRFKASVNFNGEIFESPTYCSTLRQAEHAAAEVSLNLLSSRVPSKSLTAKILVSDFVKIFSSSFMGFDHITRNAISVYIWFSRMRLGFTRTCFKRQHIELVLIYQCTQM